MNRKATVAAILVTAISLIVASCTLPAPPANDWTVRAVSAEVHDPEDWDPGDEPYAIQLGFRSKLGVPGSAVVTVNSQCNNFTPMPTTDVGAPGTTYEFPPGAADISFPEAVNLDLGDVLLGTAPLELFGTLTFLMERDSLFEGSCAWTDLIATVLPGLLGDALNLLIGNSAVPPTEQDLINLIVNNIGNLLAAVPGFIAIALEGLGASEDDLLGMVAQIHLPTAGAFTNLLDLGLSIAGLSNGVIPLEDLGVEAPENLVVRVGHLLPSSASMDITGPGWDYTYTSAVG